jgi:hypothetical protein
MALLFLSVLQGGFKLASTGTVQYLYLRYTVLLAYGGTVP